ncbi:hypothetical protein TURU_100497 [Turdus rufiventris]|nr:hypothetical protein TURU_100497 [Turdus rufiventris]
MVRQTVSLEPLEISGGTDIPLQPLEDLIPEHMDAQKKAVTLSDSLAGAGSWQGPADPWREKPTLEQVCWQD